MTQIRRFRRGVEYLFLCLFLAASSPVMAATFVVASDGSGDFLTVVEAVAAAFDGDEILIMPGSYPEAIETSKSLTFAGQGSPQEVVLSGSGIHRILKLTGPLDFTVRNLTFTDGYHPDTGGAIHVREGAHLLAENCRFLDNSADFDGGACQVRHYGSSAHFVDCVFNGNRAFHSGGAMNSILSSTLTIEGCWFERNSTSQRASAVAGNGNAMSVDRSVFVGNFGGSVTLYANTTSTITRCTLHANQAGSAAIITDGETELRQTILSGTRIGGSLWVQAPTIHECNVYWGNEGDGDSIPLLSLSEVDADPLFCAPGAERPDLTVSALSPAAPSLSTCGEAIGALPVACDEEVAFVLLQVQTVMGSTGNPTDVSLTLQAVGGFSGASIPLAGIDLALDFDPSALEFQGLELAPPFSAWQMALNDTESGKLRLSMASALGVDVPDTSLHLLNLSFIPWSETGTHILRLTSTQLYDPARQAVEHATRSGAIAVLCHPGDPTGDGHIDSADAIMALQAAVGLIELDAEEFCSADLDGDGEITVGDGVLVLRRAVGLLRVPPPSPETGQIAISTEGNRLRFSLERIAGWEAEIEGTLASGPIDVESSSGLAVTRSEGERLHLAFAQTDEAPVEIIVSSAGRILPEGIRILASQAFDSGGHRREAHLSENTLGHPVRSKKLSVQLRPNPFNPTTEVAFELAAPSSVRFEAFDLRGKLVRSLRLSELGAGSHSLRFDAVDERGARLASGVYLLRVTAEDIGQSETVRATLVK